jgi:1,4-dihydroxy-2-naphthoate octaprenyltransferase
MLQAVQQTKVALKVWLQAIRVFSLTASIIPVLVGAALAFYMNEDVLWQWLPVVAFCSVLLHAGTNLVSDYFDYNKGVDKDYTYGSSRVIVENLLGPRAVLAGGLVCFAVGCGLGLALVAFRGWPMLALGLVGLLGGWFYTAGPLGFKYMGLGDLYVFILMGPLMVIGSFFALTGRYENSVLIASMPIGCLVAGILSANNLRDIKHDGEAGVRTTAGLLGVTAAKIEYILLLFTAYVSVIAMMAVSILPVWSALVFLTLPLAVKNTKAARNHDLNRPHDIAFLDVRTAQLHLTFGLLLCLSLVLGAML